jgi:hypothetical protein
MDLLKLELQEGRLPQDFLSKLKPISEANLSKFNILVTTFDQTIRSVFASPNEDLFNTGLDLLTEYSELDEIDFKDYIMAADGDDYEDFANNFYIFKDYVFSKDGVRGLTSADWVAGVAFTYRPSEGVLEVYSPDEGDLGVIKISPSTQAKLSDLVKKASTISAGKTFFTDGSGEFVIGK